MRARLLLALACLAAPPARAASPEEIDQLVQSGFDSLYAMDYDAAEATISRIIEAEPEHPYGHFGLALAAGMRFAYGSEQSDLSLIGPFQDRVGTALEKTRSWLAKHPDDAHALLTLGACHGVMSRLLMIRRDWVKAYFQARKAAKLLREALKRDPELYDAYFGMGMYDYFTDVYPRFIGALARLALKGNRKRGIEELRLASEKGRYLRTAAQLLLVEIYMEDRFGARDPESSVRMMEDVRARYPSSQMLHFNHMLSLYEAGRYEEAVRESEEYLKRVGTGSYKPWDAAKGHVALGTIHWAQGRLEQAVEEMDAAARARLGSAHTRWSLWALIRQGQLESLLGRNARAAEHCREAAAQADTWGLRKSARRCAKPSYRHAGPVGHIFPRPDD